MNKIKFIFLFIVLCTIFDIGLKIYSFYVEKTYLKQVINDLNISLKTHDNINNLKHLIIKNYINIPKSKNQEKIWLQNRGLFRQTALETLNGKSALCGELSRVMIKLLRESGIKARRVYVYGGEGTSHVMLEYYDNNLNQWIALNSFKSTDYLEKITQEKLTIDELFNKADPQKLVYTDYSNLNYHLTKFFGYKHNIPYFFSWLMDEVYVIRIIVNIFILLVIYMIWRNVDEK